MISLFNFDDFQVSNNCCDLYKTCINPFMKYTGQGRKKILIIGEAPGELEDKIGKQFVGISGKLLKDSLIKIGLDPEYDCWFTNAVRCRPPKNRTPTVVEIRKCRDFLIKEIKELKPKLIILVGKVAFDSLISFRFGSRAKGSFSDLVGNVVDDEDFGFILTIYHPSYILRNERDKVLYNFWLNSLSKIKRYLNKKSERIKKRVFCLYENNEIVKYLQKIKGGKFVAFDIETTGLKPYKEEIKSISFAYKEGDFIEGFSFLIEDLQDKQLLFDVLQDKKIRKIGHNISFELLWIKDKWGFVVENIIWDTMIAEHIINNTRKVGLKFLVYLYFGIANYEEDIKKINELSKEQLLTYNALDSIFTFGLFEKQRELINDFERNGFKLFLEGQKVFGEIESNGMVIDVEKMKRTKENINKKLDNIAERIKNDVNVKKHFGNRSFNWNSIKHLQELFYDKMKLKYKKYTGKGNLAVDVEVLEKLNNDLAKRILSYRKWQKVYTTYLGQFERELEGNIVRPFFGLGNVASYRSSSSNPNFQNIPKRDKTIKNLIRSFIISKKGSRIVEYDYKSMEVMVMGCYSKDKNLINYLLNEDSDMHKDMAKQIFKKENITKYERYLAKNGFVFPAFYGSYYKQMSLNIWERLEQETKDHLKRVGLGRFEYFEEHLKDVEYDFWNNRFFGIQEWKRKQWEFYLKNGYIELKTGFRCKGLMRMKTVVNFPIQGSAFHCLLWTVINLHKELKKRKLKSFIVGQIHDAIVMNIFPDEEKEIDYLVWYYGTQKIREFWDWLILPLKIEKERSEVNGNWAEMNECGYLEGE